jgi:hypothetical protein
MPGFGFRECVSAGEIQRAFDFPAGQDDKLPISSAAQIRQGLTRLRCVHKADSFGGHLHHLI